jgi:signal transduction histidine kinase
VLDVKLPGLSGLDLQRRIAEIGLEIPIIFITGQGDIPMSVRAMKAGATEFLTKPFSDQDLIEAVKQGIERDCEARRRLLLGSTDNGPSHWKAKEELNRLAGEIHDGLAQNLTAISMKLGVAKEALSSRGGDPLCKIEQAIELANLGLVEARRCAHNLRFSAVDESGLLAELQRLAERWTVDDRLRCNFESDNIPENRLPSRAKHQLLRIAQEAIHNAVRHASPTLIGVTLRLHAPNVVLQVKDNGRGISADRLEKCEGFGLQNIRKRAREIGARFEIRTAVGQGTSITVTVPIS